MKRPLFFLFAILVMCSTLLWADDTQRPFVPRWVFEPWVWEDDINTETAVRELVQGYRDRDIPVGAVIIDSPWETAYNTFIVDTTRYPDMRGLIDDLHEQDVRVLLWITSLINVRSRDGLNTGQASNYQEAYDRGFFVNEGQVFKWWKGEGSFIDYTNPAAVDWWHSQMDTALSLGIDGWKVDAGNRMFPHVAKGHDRLMTKKEYSHLYYRDFYTYTREVLGDQAVTLVKSFDERTGDSTYVPPEYAPVAWVGDQRHTWDEIGILNALYNMFLSSEKGYLTVGSDIGGFEGVPGPTKTLFIRWAQLGALCPLMENGGHNEHRPWMFDEETVEIYRYYAKLHSELVPYLFSLAMQGQHTGTPILRPLQHDWHYTLGADLLVAPFYTPDPERTLYFPEGDDWIDYWNEDRTCAGGETVTRTYSLHDYPVFVRSGAIIPMAVRDDVTGHGNRRSQDHITLWIYPHDSSEFVWYADRHTPIPITCHEHADQVQVTVDAGAGPLLLRIDADARPARIDVNGEWIPDRLDEEQLFRHHRGWLWDELRGAVWIRLDTGGAAQEILLSDASTPPLPSVFSGTVAVDGQPAPSGTWIVARVNDAVVDSIRVGRPGQFRGFEIRSDDPNTRKTDGGSAGDSVRFEIHPGPHVLPVDSRFPWRSGSHLPVHLSADHPVQTGAIRIETNLEEAGFSLHGPVTLQGRGADWFRQGLPVGSYTLRCEAVDGYTTPDPRTGTLIRGDTLCLVAPYRRVAQTSAPVFKPPPGDYRDSVLVTLRSSEPHARIHFTLDGSTPTLNAPEFTDPLWIADSTEIKAMAWLRGLPSSETVSARYDIQSTADDVSRLANHQLTAGAVDLFANYPNPFRTSTTIPYYLPIEGSVQLAVYNMLGREIVSLATGPHAAGPHSVQWHGRNDRNQPVPSGLYFARLTGSGRWQQVPMILIR
jgi:hypothetical protein